MKGLRERLATAASSAQLGEEETDVVAGFALAQGFEPGKVLAGHLWRLRAGDMRSLKPAVLLMTRILSGRAKRRKWRGGPPLLARFAERVLFEWMRDRCERCRGVGYVSAADTVRTFLVGEPLRLCPACRGSSRPKVNAAERAAALGVSMDVYLRQWEYQFDWMHERIRSIDGSISAPMMAQLEESPK